MRNFFFATLSVFLMASCSKTDEKTGETTTEVSSGLVQSPIVLKSAAGEELSVTYYSEGDLVAVKVQKAGEAEEKLLAKTVNHAGNPIFSNDNYMWEITNDGQGGKLSDKAGKAVDYKLAK